MIAITAADGSLIRSIPQGVEGGVFGFHKIFGFINAAAVPGRIKNRKSHGLPVMRDNWLFQFKIERTAPAGFIANSLAGCNVTRNSNGTYELLTPVGQFFLSDTTATISSMLLPEHEEESDSLWKWAAIFGAIALLFLLIPSGPEKVVAPEVLEPVTVKLELETQKHVSVPTPAMTVPKNVQVNTKEQQVKRAVQQDLGFLGLLGKKNLTKALGGMPSTLKDASPGAGAGGKEGSGGESLVGLGQGVTRVTVGNTGTKGLGGIGTKGAGGGAGGYGNSMVASGDGQRLSALPLSQDMVLDGGLDRAIIQATIAKYLAQVRACYEQGLQKNSALAGQVSMGFEINGGGALNYAKVSKSSLGDSQVEQCISERMMTWKFPKPVGGVNVKVVYPFLLRPVSS